jgi:NAD-dependent dihydropyrimidine dehydrogenase PreA subunit
MTIERIDPDLCNGCGICINSCQIDVIRMDKKNKKAVIKYPEECMVCCVCEQDCPQHAITVSLKTNVPRLTLWGD